MEEKWNLQHRQTPPCKLHIHMSKQLHLQRWVNVMVRTLFMFNAQAIFIVFLKSDAATQLTGNPLAGRLHYGATPLETAALVAVAILFFLWQHGTIAWGPFHKKILAAAALCWLTLAALSLFFAHPPAPWTALFEGMNGEALGPSLFAALRYSVIISMFVPLLFLFFPPAFLRAHTTLLCIAGGTVVAYMWLSILRIAIHGPMATVVLGATYRLLSLFSGDVSMNTQDLTLTSGSFSVIIGPECLGLDSVVLFVCVWPLLWHLASLTRTVSTNHALAGLLGGVFVLLALNIIRITLLMIVGGILPTTAVDLFHGGIGALLFLSVLLAFMPLLRERRQ